MQTCAAGRACISVSMPAWVIYLGHSSWKIALQVNTKIQTAADSCLHSPHLPQALFASLLDEHLVGLHSLDLPGMLLLRPGRSH